MILLDITTSYLKALGFPLYAVTLLTVTVNTVFSLWRSFGVRLAVYQWHLTIGSSNSFRPIPYPSIGHHVLAAVPSGLSIDIVRQFFFAMALTSGEDSPRRETTSIFRSI